MAAVAVALAGPASAQGVWSSARTFDAPHADLLGTAVNGRGDTVVAWASRSLAQLRVTALPAHGPRVTRVLTRLVGRDLTVKLDERGGATAAWIARGSLYAAHGSLNGHWSAPQLIARRDVFGPVLAVSRDRRALLVWTNMSQTGPGSTGVAWRSPGHRFFGKSTLRRPAPGLVPGELPQSDNGAAFDRDGRAYVWSTCDGVVRIARPGSRRLSLVKVAPGRALGFSLAVSSTGRGLASWVDSRCTSDPAAGSEPGRVLVRVLRSGTFAGPVTLSFGSQPPEAHHGRSTSAFALGDGGLVTVLTDLSMNPFAVSFDAQGAPAAATEIADQRLPSAADGGGDLILSAPYVGWVVRPRAGPDEPSDWGGTGRMTPAGGWAAASTSGRRFAVVWDPDVTIGPDNRPIAPAKRLSVSLWAPSRSGSSSSS